MKKIFSCVIVLAAVAMVSCCGNSNKKAAEGAAVEATAVEATDACAGCAEKCDSTAACDKADSTATCCESTEAAK